MRYAKTWPDSRRVWASGGIPPDALICVAIAQLVQLMVRYVDNQTSENASICDEQLQNVLSMYKNTLNIKLLLQCPYDIGLSSNTPVENQHTDQRNYKLAIYDRLYCNLSN